MHRKKPLNFVFFMKVMEYIFCSIEYVCVRNGEDSVSDGFKKVACEYSHNQAYSLSTNCALHADVRLEMLKKSQ